MPFVVGLTIGVLTSSWLQVFVISTLAILFRIEKVVKVLKDRASLKDLSPGEVDNMRSFGVIDKSHEEMMRMVNGSPIPMVLVMLLNAYIATVAVASIVFGIRQFIR